MSFHKTVWQNLSAIDVSKHIEKKMNLSYLSWAWAWATLMNEYPESDYAFREPITLSDGSVEVWVDVTITDGDQNLTRAMWLPVMNHKNQAILTPSSRDISDTRMRCLVKCLAMFGLGFSLYAGEDLPDPKKEPPKKRVNKKMVQEYVAAFVVAIADKDGLSMKELGDELKDTPEHNAVWSALDSAQKKAVKDTLLQYAQTVPSK